MADGHRIACHIPVAELTRLQTDAAPVAAGMMFWYALRPPRQSFLLGPSTVGWVAEHRIAQYLPDASTDPRANWRDPMP